MKSIFFIPATKIDKVNKIIDLKVKDIIIDFEDSILTSKRDEFINKVFLNKNYKDFWYRLPLRNELKDEINFDFIKTFLEKGINKIVIPKLISKIELENLINRFKDFQSIKFIILVEHPRLLLEIQQTLQNKDFSKYIYGLGLGSHDLMLSIGAIHSDSQLDYPRKKTLYLAKAYSKVAIDIASMNISDKKDFEKELVYGISNGFESKFIIHPIQIKWLEEFELIKMNQIEWAKKILNAIPEDIIGSDMEPIVIDGEIIEKPHVEKALSILKKHNDEK